MASLRLGRIASGPTPHLPALARYTVQAPLPQPPDVIDWGNGIGTWPMLANDRLGDCTIAAVLHYAQAAERWCNGVGRNASDANAIAGYETLGYTPLHPETDIGARIVDVLQHWRAAGFAFCDETNAITAFVRVSPAELQQALWLFGPLIVGAAMPAHAQSQIVWSSPENLSGEAAPGSWGGHCMLLTNWHADASVDLITWGGVKHAEAGWVSAYVDEAWAVLHPSWIASGRSPSGWHIEALTADLAALAAPNSV